eukprot:309718-Ditylum_brightwellii.AAC.1
MTYLVVASENTGGLLPGADLEGNSVSDIGSSPGGPDSPAGVAPGPEGHNDLEGPRKELLALPCAPLPTAPEPGTAIPVGPVAVVDNMPGTPQRLAIRDYHDDATNFLINTVTQGASLERQWRTHLFYLYFQKSLIEGQEVVLNESDIL